jgi:uncharacterized protein (TIGR00725 family)
MDVNKRIRIGVIGGAQPEEQWRQAAGKIGELIATRGGILVCGGLGGVMESAAKGAKQAGGFTVGILPGQSARDANPYIDLAVATGLGYTRNSLVVLNSDVLIAVDGQYGTLSEIAYGLIYGKKVIGLGSWDVAGVTPASTPEEAVQLAFSH